MVFFLRGTAGAPFGAALSWCPMKHHIAPFSDGPLCEVRLRRDMFSLTTYDQWKEIDINFDPGEVFTSKAAGEHKRRK